LGSTRRLCNHGFKRQFQSCLFASILKRDLVKTIKINLMYMRIDSKTYYHMKGFIPKVALNQRQNELRMMAFYIALDNLVHHRKLPLPQYVVN